MLNREEAALFSAKANSGQCSHAYIVDGAKGVGKLSFAIHCASAMLCVGEDKPCGECSHCRKIAGGDHPDLHIFGKEKSISIDDVREIIRRSSLKPNDSDKQIFILCGDSKLSSSVQNALLKIIEEPPETVALFILTESRSSLLPTVLSRGQRIHLDGLSDKEMTEKLKEAFPKATFGDIYTAVDFACGNYGEAERFLSKESSAVRTKAEKIFQAAVTRDSYDLMAALILPKYKRDQLIPILSEFIFMIA
jgi:DNA polymerase-3 subunit delta'